MQNLSLALATVAIAISGYALIATPESTGGLSDSERLRMLSNEIEQLRKEMASAVKHVEGPAYQEPEAKLDDTQAKPGPEATSDEMLDLDEEEDALAEDLPPIDPLMAAQVQRIIRQERKRLRGDRWNRRLNRFVDRMEERIASHGTTTGMSDDERKDLSDALTKDREQIHALIRKLRSGEKNVAEARSELGAIRRSTEEEIRELFGDDVADALNDLSPLPRRGPFAPARGTEGPTGPR